MKVVVFGGTHLGLVTGVCLASMGHEVKIDVPPGDYSRNTLEKVEPGLGRLAGEYCHSITYCIGCASKEHVKDADVIWFCYETPVKDGVPYPEVITTRIANDMRAVEIPRDALVTVSSQLPVGSTERLATEFQDFRICYIPENLRHGDAIKRFMEPDRVVVGRGMTPGIDDQIEKLLPRMRKVWTGFREAEMIKHAINAFLATEISFANDIGRLCDALGVNKEAVRFGMQTDHRIGSESYLRAGGPYTSQTLGRDLWYLLNSERCAGPAMHTLVGVRRANELRKEEIANEDDGK